VPRGYFVDGTLLKNIRKRWRYIQDRR